MRDGMFLLFWWNAERLSVVEKDVSNAFQHPDIFRA